LQKSICKFWNL